MINDDRIPKEAERSPGGRRPLTRGDRITRLAVTVITMLLTGVLSQASAQGDEEEPNDTCAEAQDMGSIDSTNTLYIQGEIDNDDVDFFRFSATSGARIRADQEGESTDAGTLEDPFLGLFDSDCSFLASNDDLGSLNSRLTFGVPSDGIFILAASSCCDEGFTGDGDSSGSYQLTISPPPPSAGSIAGRIIDATTGEPLSGWPAPPYAFAELYRCENGDCDYYVSYQDAGVDGRFKFELDSSGQPIDVGTYQVTVYADEYEQATTDQFMVGEGEDIDIGDIPLEPPAISVSDLQPCDELLPQGGICRYSFQLNNNTNAPMSGLAWSVVDGYSLGSSLGYTLFEASTRDGSGQALRENFAFEPLGNATLAFQFRVPPFASGEEFCTRVFVGVDPSPLVTTVREAYLFCITGNDANTGFEVIGETESRRNFQSIGERHRNSFEKRPRRAR